MDSRHKKCTMVKAKGPEQIVNASCCRRNPSTTIMSIKKLNLERNKIHSNDIRNETNPLSYR